MSNSDEPQQNRSALRDFIKSIWSISGDLSSITAPPFLIGDRSAVEYPASWAEFSNVLVAPSLEEDPEKRALLVLKWYLSSLKRQQYAAGKEDSGIKKPLNPFLGELFLGKWDNDAGNTVLISEQVSHRPPITACYIMNDEHGVNAQGYASQEITLTRTGNVNIRQIGHTIMTLSKYNEKYMITFPSVQVRGLLTGGLYPELIGKAYIISTSGYTSEIDFTGKTFGFGTKNNVNAKFFKTDQPEKILTNVTGHWNHELYFANTKTMETDTLNVDALEAYPIEVAKVEYQDPWESRNAWQHVIQAVREGDMAKITREKTKIEKAQRQIRSETSDYEEFWEPKFFTKSKGDPEFEALATKLKLGFGYERTGGVWRFDEEKARSVSKPFYENKTPLG